MVGPANLGLAATTVNLVDDDVFPHDCPEGASAAMLWHYFVKERLKKRGAKVSQTAWCYIYKAFYDTVISTYALVYILEEAKALSKREQGSYFCQSTYTIWSIVAGWVVCYFFAYQCDFIQLDKRGFYP